jgi:hypothetical protein
MLNRNRLQTVGIPLPVNVCIPVALILRFDPNALHALWQIRKNVLVGIVRRVKISHYTKTEVDVLVLNDQNDQIPNKVSTHTIISVAATADKYNIRAPKFASESCLHPVYNQASDLLVLGATAAVYLFQDATAFRKTIEKIELNHNWPLTAISYAHVEAVMYGYDR